MFPAESTTLKKNGDDHGKFTVQLKLVFTSAMVVLDGGWREEAIQGNLFC
jgi:hypothetical protein